MIITIGGQKFGPFEIDGDGTHWMITELDGWAGAPVRANSLERTYAHGSAPAGAFYAPRQMTAKGVVKAPTEALFWKAYNRLSSLVNLTVPSTMTVEEDVLKHIDVVLAAEARKTFVGVGAITFELPLTAYDPLKYGAGLSTSIPAGTTRTIVNAGNERSPHIVVSATSTGIVSLTNIDADATLTTGGNALEADSVIDFRKRSVYWNGLNRYGRLHSSSTWWMLQTGANRIANVGTTAVNVAYRPAWA